MTWKEFYGKFYDWADSTQISKISQLTSFETSSSVHSEVSEIVQSISDEKAASRLVLKAVSCGVKFTVSEITDFQLYVTKDCMNELVRTCSYPFSQEQVEELACGIDDKLYAELENKYCDYGFKDNTVQGKRKPGLLSGLFAFLGIASETADKGSNRRFKIGDHVRVKWRGQEGTIIDINKDLYMVSLDDGKSVDSYPESELEKAT